MVGIKKCKNEIQRKHMKFSNLSIDLFPLVPAFLVIVVMKLSMIVTLAREFAFISHGEHLL